MKQIRPLLLASLFISILLSGCGERGADNETDTEKSQSPNSSQYSKEISPGCKDVPAVMARLAHGIDKRDKTLIAASLIQESDNQKSAAVAFANMRLDLGPRTVKFLENGKRKFGDQFKKSLGIVAGPLTARTRMPDFAAASKHGTIETIDAIATVTWNDEDLQKRVRLMFVRRGKHWFYRPPDSDSKLILSWKVYSAFLDKAEPILEESTNIDEFSSLIQPIVHEAQKSWNN